MDFYNHVKWKVNDEIGEKNMVFLIDNGSSEKDST